MTPAVSLQVPVGNRPGSDVRSVVDLARRAEDAGFDGLTVVDHVVMGTDPSQYPLGTFPFPPDAPWQEPLTVLAAVAATTSTLTLQTSVLVAPLRPAGLLAKTVATLDELSGGRLELGVGLGWQREEYEACGLDFARRGALLDDIIGACRALWSGRPASFSSASVTFSDIWCEPRPARPGGPPVLFGGRLYARNVGRIVSLGDGWVPHPQADEAEIASGIGLLRRSFVDAGRDPEELLVHAMRVSPGRDGEASVEATLDRLDDYGAMGVTSIALPIALFAGDVAAWPAWFRLVERRLSATIRGRS